MIAVRADDQVSRQPPAILGHQRARLVGRDDRRIGLDLHSGAPRGVDQRAMQVDTQDDQAAGIARQIVDAQRLLLIAEADGDAAGPLRRFSRWRSRQTAPRSDGDCDERRDYA